MPPVEGPVAVVQAGVMEQQQQQQQGGGQVVEAWKFDENVPQDKMLPFLFIGLALRPD